jgi:hypothetical protein
VLLSADVETLGEVADPPGELGERVIECGVRAGGYRVGH